MSGELPCVTPRSVIAIGMPLRPFLHFMINGGDVHNGDRACIGILPTGLTELRMGKILGRDFRQRTDVREIGNQERGISRLLSVAIHPYATRT